MESARKGCAGANRNDIQVELNTCKLAPAPLVLKQEDFLKAYNCGFYDLENVCEH